MSDYDEMPHPDDRPEVTDHAPDLLAVLETLVGMPVTVGPPPYGVFRRNWSDDPDVEEPVEPLGPAARDYLRSRHA